MLIRQFVDKVIAEIKSGIDEINSKEGHIKAQMPTEIEFVLKTMKVRWDDQDFIIMHNPHEVGEVQTN